MIPALNSQDKRRVDLLMNKLENASIGLIQDQFYSIANMPLQSVCTVGKFFGGQWLGGYGCLDGNKFVCLDKLFGDVLDGRCLIYSFGISNDWSFEEAMADLGCIIRTFDPTIDGKTKPKTEQVLFNGSSSIYFTSQKLPLFCLKLFRKKTFFVNIKLK